MSSFTEAAQATARRATRKTRRRAIKARTAAAKARTYVAKKLSTAVRAVGKAIGWTGKKGTHAAAKTGSATMKATNATFRFTGTALRWTISLVWTLVSTTVALVSYTVAWVLSLVSGAVFALGVGFAIFAMLMTWSVPDVPAPPAKVSTFTMPDMDRPATDPFDPDSYVRDDEYVEPPMTIVDIERSNAVVYRQLHENAVNKGDREVMSYYFGKLQAAEAITARANITSGRGWALVSKTILNDHTFLRKEVKRGWDEEFDDAQKRVLA